MHDKGNAFLKINCVSGRRDASKASMICFRCWLTFWQWTRLQQMSLWASFWTSSAVVALFPWVFRRRWHKHVWLDSKSVWMLSHWFHWTRTRTIGWTVVWYQSNATVGRHVPRSIHWCLTKQSISCCHLQPPACVKQPFCSHWHENQMQIKTEHRWWYTRMYVAHITTFGQTLQRKTRTAFTLN